MIGAPLPADAELATRAAAGEQRAFATLMTRHKEPLYRLIRRYGVGREDAYDLLQQTFVSAWSGLKRYDPDRSFQTWLRAIALNKCRDWSRRLAVRRLLLSPVSLDQEVVRTVADPAPGSEAAAIDQQRQEGLARAVGALPAALKEPLLLTILDGYSQKEVGELLGLTTKAVELRLARARKELARKMAGPQV